MTPPLPQKWPDKFEQRHTQPLARFFGRITSPKMLRNHDQLTEAVRGKVVVITGASTGLGAAVARHCGRAGAIVVMCARSTDALDRVARTIQADGGLAFPYSVDMADSEQVRDFATSILRDHGQVDVLIHNAGKSLNRSVHLSYRRPKDLFATTGVNYLGPARLTLLLLPYMRARRSGHIINIATAGLLLFPAPRWGFYLASKAAFDWWLRAVASEVRRDGIATTHYYLGSVRTKMSAPDQLLKLLPNQSAEDAAWGVARAIVKRPRAVAWRPLFGVHALTVALRGPLEVVCGLALKYTHDTAASTSRALPQENWAYGDPPCHYLTNGS